MSRTDASAWVPAPTSVSRLRKAAQACQGCDLYEHASQAVMGDGSETASLMIVGEQPGDQEDRVGEPFVGPAGKLLDKALEQAGIDPETVYVTNAVKHFRFSGTKGKRRIHQSPSRWHVVACQPWLLAELELVRPVGVALGATAGSALLGSGFRLKDHRGRVQSWPASAPKAVHPPRWFLATTHPSAVLRSRSRSEDLALLVADLELARDELRRPAT